ncbi:MAG: hypothetical protein LBG75_01995 [Candidatus Nomurabacteria bacterium]|jgi:hypothetical protein|nr:hypothetical protein [Candidatus Nomurabacteria bacterium]
MAQEVAIKKRQAISNASRNMFIAVAGASVLVGFAIVGSIFLIQKMMFNARVIGAKQDTASILTDNNKEIVTLENNIKALRSNSALRKVMVGDGSDSLRVLPDALPSFYNQEALGASVMNVLLDPVITVDSFSFASIGASEGEATAGKLQSIEFSFTAQGTPEEVSKAIQNLEHSIRQVDITQMSVSFSKSELGGSILELRATARAYYTSSVSIKLGEKEISSGDGAKSSGKETSSEKN